MRLRQQSALEFVSTYSFAIFTITLVLLAATAISFSIGTTAPVYSVCSIQPLITCKQAVLTYNSAAGGSFTYILEFRNNLGYSLQFPPNAINLSATKFSSSQASAFGSCSPSVTLRGAQAICIVTTKGSSLVRQGSEVYTQFSISYNLCTNQSSTSCSPNTYSSTGYSFQTISRIFTNLYPVLLSSSNGEVIINGEPYMDNTIVYLASGSYSIYAQPNSGYTFNTMYWSGNSVTTLSSSKQSSTLTLMSSGNVVAVFNH